MYGLRKILKKKCFKVYVGTTKTNTNHVPDAFRTTNKLLKFFLHLTNYNAMDFPKYSKHK
jgi:hypothetical protein